MAINPITTEAIEAIKRKTAFMLPDNPSEQGMKAADIKKAFYQSQTDSNTSIIASINRIVGEANIEIQASRSSVATHEAKKDNPHNVSKEQVGLSNVDNTSDLDKPVSTATQQAINTLTLRFQGHQNSTANPHNITKFQVGLGNCDNTSDMEKPVSYRQQEALDQKVNSVDIVDDCNTEDSTKPVSARQAKLLAERFDELPENYATEVDVSYNAANGHITFFLKDNYGNVLSQKTIDLPLELVLATSGSYCAGGTLYLKLANGEFLEVDVSNLIASVSGDGATINIVNGVATLSPAVQEKVDTTYGAAHSHGNHALIETYRQTEENLARAVENTHNHSNFNVLANTTASFTQQDKNNLDALHESALPRTEIITIYAGDWNSSKKCVKSSDNASSTNILFVSPGQAFYNEFISAGIRAITQSDNSITFECDVIPSVNVEVQVVAWGGA